jgi:hypothetical protein
VSSQKAKEAFLERIWRMKKEMEKEVSLVGPSIARALWRQKRNIKTLHILCAITWTT